MPDQPAPPASHGGPDRQFPAPRDAASQQQARDVQAGDQQHDPDRAQQNPKSSAQVAARQPGELFLKIAHHRRKLPLLAVATVNRRVDREQFGFRRGAGDTGLQPSEDEHGSLVEIRKAGGDQAPHFGSLRVESKARRHHSGNRAIAPVETDPLSRDPRVRRKGFGPERVRKHYLASGRGIAGSKRPAVKRLHAQNTEERIADSYGGHPARKPAPGQHRRADRPRRCCQFFEGSGILPEGAVIRIAVEQLGEARLAGAPIKNIDQPLRVAVRQRTQKSTVNDAEDRGVGSAPMPRASVRIATAAKAGDCISMRRA